MSKGDTDGGFDPGDGAAGEIGRELIPQLVVAGQQVRALVRDPGRADFDSVVEVVRADLQHPDTLDAAFAGVQKAFVGQRSRHRCAGRQCLRCLREPGSTHRQLSALESFQEHMAGTVTARTPGKRKPATPDRHGVFDAAPGVLRVQLHTYFLQKSSAGAAMYLPCGDGKEATIDPRDIAPPRLRC